MGGEMTKKLIVITGVTRGCGRAMFERFSEMGHAVHGCGRDRSFVEQMRKEFGNARDVAVVDVASDEEVKNWASHLLQSYGAPDLLVNNAAVINANQPLWKISASEFSRVIDV